MSLKTGNKIDNHMAAWLLYAVSVLGILNLFMTKTLVGHYTSLIMVDVIVYICLAIIAFFIHMGLRIANIIYAIVAICWYIVLIGFLPQHFGHDIDLYFAFTEIIITILAYCILYSPHPGRRDTVKK